MQHKKTQSVKLISMKESTSLENLSNIEGVISSDDLREDIVVEASDVEKQRIIDNFPRKKNNYLVVPKAIEE